jgi:hypothetical protein
VRPHVTRYSGQCACGAIRVHLSGAPGALVYCHCAQCRKTAGAPFIAVIPVAETACEIEDPQGLLREFRATPGKARCFCAGCGAPILSRRDGAAVVRVRAGLFDLLGPVAHDGHIFAAAAAPWDDSFGALPRYPGLEPGR